MKLRKNWKLLLIAFRDTFSKEIYNRLFGFLVKRMNLTLFDENIRKKVEDDDDIRHIGLLDIFDDDGNIDFLIEYNGIQHY